MELPVLLLALETRWWCYTPSISPIEQV